MVHPVQARRRHQPDQSSIECPRQRNVRVLERRDDARSKCLATTPKQRAFWVRRNPQDHASVEQWLSHLDDKEKATLVRLLAKAMAGAREARGV
jgi:hypothetical protein